MGAASIIGKPIDSSLPGRSQTEIVFLLGIMGRSGTNFLEELLCMHPDCGALVPVREAYLLDYAYLLVDYVESVYKSWSPKWGCDESLKKRLLQFLGSGLTSFLISLTDEDWIKGPWPSLQEDIYKIVKPAPKKLIVKTPSVKNLQLLSIFPQVKAIVLVRDGRSVVESGIRSFQWKFDKAAKIWGAAANILLENKRSGTPFLLVKYEDIVRDLRTQMERILSYLELDSSTYDFRAAQNCPVRGSSVFRGAIKNLHWSALPKEPTFNPLNRWKDWTRIKHERFNWIAGDSLDQLGYEPITYKHLQALYGLYNLSMDLKLFLTQQARQMYVHVRKSTQSIRMLRSIYSKVRPSER